MYWHNSNIPIQYGMLKNHVIWNKGISFGLLANSYYNVLVYCCIILSILLILYTWFKTKNATDSIAWGLIVGGGLSNLWDRWFFGGVLDFIAISVNDFHFPIFNFADIAITFGVLILFRTILFKKKKRPGKSEESSKK
jgi:signal peptidase II